MHHLKRVLTLLLLSGLLSLLTYAPVQAETIHDVVSATWPAELVPVAEQIAYHEGGGIFSDGYCSFGIIESTQYVYGIDASALDPYECSSYAYQIYLDAGWGAWTTYGWYDPYAPGTEVMYY